MSKTWKRLASMLLALMLVLSLAPALAEGEEPIVITVSGVMARPNNDLVYMHYLEKKFNVKFECNFMSKEAWETQSTILLANDNLPDLLLDVNFSKLDADRYGQEGFFLDFTKYLDIMPDYAALLEKDHALNAFARDEFGSIYGMYKTRGNLCSREVAMAYMNNEWLKNVGMEYPTTTEELYNVLKAFKEKDANGNGDPDDEIPFSFTVDQASGQRVEFSIRNSFGIYGYKNNYQLQVTDGKVWLADVSDNYKAYLTFMHRLYKDKLLDNDCFIQTNDEYQAKINAGRVGYFGSWSTLDRVFTNEDKRMYLDYTFVTGFKSDLVDEIIYPLWNPVTETAVDVVSASTKHPEKICEILNYFYTEQGMQDVWLCCDGVNGTLVEGPYGLKSVDGTGYYEDSGMSYIDWKASNSHVDNAFVYTQYNMAQKLVDESTLEELKGYLDEAAKMDDPSQQVLLIDAFKDYYVRQVKTCDDYPQVSYTTAEAEEKAIILTDITTYLTSMKAQFITGEIDIETGWDTYLQRLSEMRLDRLMEIEQEAYDRYAKNL